MDWIIKILGFIVIALIGFSLVPLMANLLTLLNIIDVEKIPDGFGNAMITRATYIWLGSVGLAIFSLFIVAKWRYILKLAPLYAPTIFIIIYAFSQN